MRLQEIYLAIAQWTIEQVAKLKPISQFSECKDVPPVRLYYSIASVTNNITPIPHPQLSHGGKGWWQCDRRACRVR
jgi:hypothetical protein